MYLLLLLPSPFLLLLSLSLLHCARPHTFEHLLFTSILTTSTGRGERRGRGGGKQSGVLRHHILLSSPLLPPLFLLLSHTSAVPLLLILLLASQQVAHCSHPLLLDSLVQRGVVCVVSAVDVHTAVFNEVAEDLNVTRLSCDVDGLLSIHIAPGWALADVVYYILHYVGIALHTCGVEKTPSSIILHLRVCAQCLHQVLDHLEVPIRDRTSQWGGATARARVDVGVRVAGEKHHDR
mmetsp:Transcript_25261/g.63367  ORF Transcript_25261/g.63367 Transcript_25261/m.63367 type:complete len:236 (-) Transcript_25261:256-963(-)